MKYNVRVGHDRAPIQAPTAELAVATFLRWCGIRSTSHEPEVSELPEDALVVATWGSPIKVHYQSMSHLEQGLEPDTPITVSEATSDQKTILAVAAEKAELAAEKEALAARQAELDAGLEAVAAQQAEIEDLKAQLREQLEKGITEGAVAEVLPRGLPPGAGDGGSSIIPSPFNKD